MENCKYSDRGKLKSNVAWYLEQLPKKRLDKEEQRKLFIKYQSGDQEAKEKLILHNLALVVFIAKKHQNKGVPLLDLIQIGNQGLMKAFETFDLKKDIKFSTHASWCILQAILNNIRDTARIIRIPVYRREWMENFFTSEETLRNKLNREPSKEELKNEMHISDDRLNTIYLDMLPIDSLNQKISEDSDQELGEFVTGNVPTPTEYENEMDLKTIVGKLLMNSGLTEKEIRIVILYFGLDNGKERSLTAVGRMMGCTCESVRQTIQRALRKMRNNKSIIEYADYLGEFDNLKQRIEELQVKNRRAASNLYEFFPNNTKEDVDIVLSMLSLDEIESLHMSYDDNWNKIQLKTKLLSKDSHRIGAIIRKMKFMLAEIEKAPQKKYGK